MNNYLLIDSDDLCCYPFTILDNIICSSKEIAEQLFFAKGWVLGTVVLEEEYLEEISLYYLEKI